MSGLFIHMQVELVLFWQKKKNKKNNNTNEIA